MGKKDYLDDLEEGHKKTYPDIKPKPTPVDNTHEEARKKFEKARKERENGQKSR